MNNPLTKTELLADLVADKLLSPAENDKAEKLLDATSTLTTPWFVHILQGIGAWLSAIAFILFFALLQVLDGELELTIAGLTLLVIALASTLYNKQNKSTYSSQLLFVSSLTGHALFTVGMGILSDNIYLPAISLMVISIIFLLFYHHSVHKFLSVHLLLIALLVFASEQKAIDSMITLQMTIVTLLSCHMWLYESRYMSSDYQHVFRPIQYALISTLLIGAGIMDQFHNELTTQWLNLFTLPVHEIIATVFFCCFAWLISHILRRLDHDWKSIVGISLCAIMLLLCLLFYRSPSILAALLVLLLGIERNNRILIPLAIIALVYFLGRYYYLLELTLLHKSLLLMASGLVLLTAGMITYRYNQNHNNSQHEGVQHHA